ncbi:hypothetical protein NL676_007657 [Syzygium grande]|nr:hypothetical protein NL676_007657 [Syzygium grande]
MGTTRQMRDGEETCANHNGGKDKDADAFEFGSVRFSREVTGVNAGPGSATGDSTAAAPPTIFSLPPPTHDETQNERRAASRSSTSIFSSGPPAGWPCFSSSSARVKCNRPGPIRVKPRANRPGPDPTRRPEFSPGTRPGQVRTKNDGRFATWIPLPHVRARRLLGPGTGSESRVAKRHGGLNGVTGPRGAGRGRQAPTWRRGPRDPTPGVPRGQEITCLVRSSTRGSHARGKGSRPPSTHSRARG